MAHKDESIGDGSQGFMWVPVTPGGTCCVWLAHEDRENAIKALMKDAAHMSYRTWADFQRRGYTVVRMQAG